MQDTEIVSLYWERNEKAIEYTSQKYGNYLTKIAYNILSDYDDSLESVNDTYFKAWNSMPPHKPDVLSVYLGKITRQLSIDIFRKRHRKKRQANMYAVSLSELEECVASRHNPEDNLDFQLLAESISAFLRTLSPEARNTFVGRYYFMDSILEISHYYGMSESNVKSLLHRTRNALRKHLIKEGFLL